jgi:hemerythrin
VSRHFVTEEELMEIYGYPGLEGQKRAHQEFANKVKELRVLVMEGDLTVMTVIFRILETWLENHIIKEDRGIGPFLNKKGLKLNLKFKAAAT